MTCRMQAEWNDPFGFICVAMRELTKKRFVRSAVGSHSVPFYFGLLGNLRSEKVGVWARAMYIDKIVNNDICILTSSLR